MRRNTYLVESALLTHGLFSIANEELKKLWSYDERSIVWLEGGVIKIGGIEEYIPFRSKADEIIRVSCENLDKAIENKQSAALTASATMMVAEREGIKLAVTSGMGGIGDIEGERICPDLFALRDMNVVLIACSPKDVVDIGKTIKWLRNEKVYIYGYSKPYIDGFMIRGETHDIDGVWAGGLPNPPLLLLNPIDEKYRLNDKSIIEAAKLAGVEAQSRGEEYHPAANKYIDIASGGLSSLLQLNQLIKNIEWAKEISRIL